MIDPRERTVEAAIVPKPIQCGNGKSGLAGIDFPGMDVEGRRLTALARFTKCATDYCQWKLAKIPTASGRYGEVENARRRKRKFRDAPADPLNDVRDSRRIGITVSAPANRKEARVVSVSFLDQNIEGPLPTRDDRKTWGAVANNLRADQILQRLL